MLSFPLCLASGPPRRLARLALPLIACVAIVGCGGSASETPFPAEPADVDLGPAGEQERPEPTTPASEPSAEKGGDPKPSSSAK